LKFENLKKIILPFFSFFLPLIKNICIFFIFFRTNLFDRIQNWVSTKYIAKVDSLYK